MELTEEQVRFIAREMANAVKEAIIECYEKESSYYVERPIYGAIKQGTCDALTKE